jgi:hypothetical protein
MAGSQVTYSFLRPRSFSHLFGSSAMLIVVVNACVVGLLAGGIVVAVGGAIGWAIIVGVLVGLLVMAGWSYYGFWTYSEAWRIHRPLRSTAPRADGAPATEAAGERPSDPSGPLRRDAR